MGNEIQALIIHESEYTGPNNFRVVRYGPELQVELTYPPRSDEDNEKGQVRYICVDQESVRASDGIRLYYDYDRDGFVIQQASNDALDDWQEVAFVQSWARQDEEIEMILNHGTNRSGGGGDAL